MKATLRKKLDSLVARLEELNHLLADENAAKDMEQFKKLIARHKKGDSVALLVRRGEGALYVPLEIGAA